MTPWELATLKLEVESSHFIWTIEGEFEFDDDPVIVDGEIDGITDWVTFEDGVAVGSGHVLQLQGQFLIA